MLQGCARISQRAAKEIADALDLDHTPSIYQGRIAGAKGVWMVDSLDETIDRPDGDFWIEITDSQLKFEAGGEDGLYPDRERVTFEVHSYARPLVQASLNFQLMPILVDREVPFHVFSSLLEADLTAKVTDLEAAMESGLAIRKWNQDVNLLTAEPPGHGPAMRGGVPSSFLEQINWFVEVSLSQLDLYSCCLHVLAIIARFRTARLLPLKGSPVQVHRRILPTTRESHENWCSQIDIRIHDSRPPGDPRGGRSAYLLLNSLRSRTHASRC